MGKSRAPIIVQTNAVAGERLVFGLVDPDADAIFRLEYGFMRPGGQFEVDRIWQPVRIKGQEVVLNLDNYPLVYNVLASGAYRLRNMAEDNTNAKVYLVDKYTVEKYVRQEEVR